MKTILTIKKLACVVVVMMFITSVAQAQNLNDYQSVGGNWGTLASWQRWNGSSWQTPTAGQGYPGQFNTPGTVTILDNDAITLNVSPTNSIGALVIQAGSNTSSLTFSGTNSLTAGDITINSGTGNGDDKTIAVAAGSLTCTSVTMATTGNDNRTNFLTISTGTVTVSGDFTLNDIAARNQVNISSSGTLNVAGAFTGGGSTFNNASTVNYNGAAQTIRSVTYGILSLSGTGAKTLPTVTITNDLNMSGSASLTTTNDLTIGDDLSIGAGASLAIGAANFIVTDDASISGTLSFNSTTGTKTFNGLVTINSGGVWDNTADESVTFNGNFTHNGATFNAGIGTQVFDADLTISGSSPITIPNMTVNSSGDDVTNSANLTITSSLAGAGEIINSASGVLNIDFGGAIGLSTVTASAAGNLVNYMFAGAQTVRNITYSNLTLSGSGTKTLSNTTTVNQTLSIQGSAVVGGPATVSYGAAAILEYKGSTAQNTSNVEFPTAVNVDLIIDNLAGVTLNGQKTLSGFLTLTNGVLTTTSTNLLIFPDNFATINGGSNTAYVDGPIRKVGNEAFTFKVGKSGLYSPLTITAPDNAADAFQAEYMRASGAALGGISSPGLHKVSNCEYWVLDEINDAGAANSISVTVGWFSNSGCGGGYITDVTTLTLAHFNTTTNMWDTHGGTANGGSTTIEGTITRTGVNVFSPFTLGGTNNDQNPLPVKFSAIKAYEKQSGIQLDWTAYQEENVDMYQIERSADGVSFAVIGTVDARNSVTEVKYGYLDAAPLAGVSFYRIRNVDFDGKEGFSNIVKVSLDKSVKDITLYPNPVRGNFLALQSSDLAKGNYAIRVMNTAGQQVHVQRFNHAGGAINESVILPTGTQSGIYVLQLERDGIKVLGKSFVVQQ